MNNDIDTIETNTEAYRVLENQTDRVDENPFIGNVAGYEGVAVLDEEAYGFNTDENTAQVYAELRKTGAEVYGTREEKGSVSGRILSEDMGDGITVKEAVDATLEPTA